MRPRMSAVVLAIVIAAITAGCAGTTSASPSAQRTGVAALVAERCARCHGLERIKKASHDAAAWAATVHRMRTQHGAQLSDAEESQVAAFLASGGAGKL